MSSSNTFSGRKIRVRELRSILLGCSDIKMCQGRPWWHLSSDLKEVEGAGWMCGWRVFQAEEQQVQRCWSTHVLGTSEELHGGHCSWRAVNRGEWLETRSRGSGMLHMQCHKSLGGRTFAAITSQVSQYLPHYQLGPPCRSEFCPIQEVLSLSLQMCERENQQQNGSRLN